jgi:hypothetical protein
MSDSACQIGPSGILLVSVMVAHGDAYQALESPPKKGDDLHNPSMLPKIQQWCNKAMRVQSKYARSKADRPLGVKLIHHIVCQT